MSDNGGETTELLQRVQHLESCLREAKSVADERAAELELTRRELRRASDQAVEQREEAERQQGSVERLQSELESMQLRMELDKLRAIESLRQEHHAQLERERQQVERECKRADSWIEDLREQFRAEKQQYLERISELESRLSEQVESGHGPLRTEEDLGHAHLLSAVHQEQAETSSLQEVLLPEERENVNRYYPCPEFEHTPPPRAGDGVETQEVGPPPLISLISNREQPFQSTDAAPNFEANPNRGQDGLVQSMAQLMQAQTNMLTAHAQAVAMQNLPALSPFTGEDPRGDDDNFEKWLELLEERGRLAQWSKEQHLCQLRAHLTKTAQQIFRMLTEEERKSYDLAVKALKKRFRPIDIEELRGLEFHQKMQDSETIEQLGIDLQSLARKAFPELRGGKEFDRLLKGRFFQALLPKWQRKLGAPKPEETFQGLYDRARMLEIHELQYATSANARKDTKSTPATTDQKNDQKKNYQQGKSKFQKTYKAPIK